MRLVLPCCLQSPCGTWHASFSTAAACAAKVKNNSMHECFAIFLRVTEFAPPMSRRQVTNRRELLLPLLIPDRHQRGVVFNPCVPPGPAAAINGEAGEPTEAWTRHSAHYRAAKQASQTTEVAIAELIARNHLLARLVLQRIRPCTHSGMIGGQSCSPDELQRSRTQIAPPDSATPLIKCAEVPVSAPIPPAIETLFTQLARRHLRSRASEKTR
jgi:hypothetical protein